MSPRRLLTGSIALVAAASWAALLVAQWPRYPVGLRFVSEAGGSLGAHAMVTSTLLMAAAGLLLVLPMALSSIAVMAGAGSSITHLRRLSTAGAVVSGGVVVTFGLAIVPAASSTSGVLLGTGALLDLLGAANLLILFLVAASLARSIPKDALLSQIPAA